MNAHLRLNVRRLDGRWRLTASDRELEHTHRHPFPSREVAERFKARVRQALFFCSPDPSPQALREPA